MLLTAQHQERVILSHTASPGKYQNSKFKVQFLLNAYHFRSTVKSKNGKLNHYLYILCLHLCYSIAPIAKPSLFRLLYLLDYTDYVFLIHLCPLSLSPCIVHISRQVLRELPQEEKMNEWMDRWMDGWIDRWVDNVIPQICSHRLKVQTQIKSSLSASLWFSFRKLCLYLVPKEKEGDILPQLKSF